VDGAIHKAAGPELLIECRSLKGCRTGEAKITKGYNLPAKHIIHTVGPVWYGGIRNERDLLEACYTNSLSLASSFQLKTIAFPNISTGVYGFPKREAAVIATNAVMSWMFNHKEFEKLYFAIFDDENYTIYYEILQD